MSVSTGSQDLMLSMRFVYVLGLEYDQRSRDVRIRWKAIVSGLNDEREYDKESVQHRAWCPTPRGCVCFWCTFVVITSRITLLFRSYCDTAWVTNSRSTCETGKTWGPQVYVHCLKKYLWPWMHSIFTAAICSYCKIASSGVFKTTAASPKSSLTWSCKCTAARKRCFWL